MENKLKESIEVLCKALREDEDYYRILRDDITMSFHDEFFRQREDSREVPADILRIGYYAADNFLKQLIK